MSRRRQAEWKVPVVYAALLSVCVLVFVGSHARSAERDAADQSPSPLPILDSRAWSDDPELTLPSNQTTLHVQAHPDARSVHPLTYKWVKVDGPPSGTATFSPNGDERSDTTTATFSADVAGTYTLRVIIGDGLAESISLSCPPGGGRSRSRPGPSPREIRPRSSTGWSGSVGAPCPAGQTA